MLHHRLSIRSTLHHSRHFSSLLSTRRERQRCQTAFSQVLRTFFGRATPGMRSIASGINVVTARWLLCLACAGILVAVAYPGLAQLWYRTFAMNLSRPKPLPAGPGQESVWQFPRPAVAQPTPAHLRVEFNGATIASTKSGFRTLETSHPPSYYIPPGDINMQYLRCVIRRSGIDCNFGIIRRF